MKERRSYTRHNERGFGALEVLITLLIATLTIAGAIPLYMRYVDRQSNLVASGHMRIVADAATQYIKDNYSAVLAAATPSAPAVITTAMLRSTGYLQSGFADRNPYGQDYRILALEPAANKLQTLIVTVNGEVIKELYLIEIAKLIGAQGGYVSTFDTTVATGSFGGWKTSLAPYGITPGAGHLATALFFDDGALVNDYLYRHAVPGQPELQTMHAAIDMNTNNLNNAGTVNAATVNVSANTKTAGETYTGGWFRSTGDGGWYQEKYAGGWFMTDPTWVRSYGDKGVYTGGEMRAGKLTSAGRTEVGEFLQLNAWATEGAGCAPNGLLARDGPGKTLSCQSGIWTANTSEVSGWVFSIGGVAFYGVGIVRGGLFSGNMKCQADTCGGFGYVYCGNDPSCALSNGTVLTHYNFTGFTIGATNLAVTGPGKLW